ncbi:MAG: ABC transporter substrate-binding protein [Candidatus Limnocylindrales bacterium]
MKTRAIALTSAVALAAAIAAPAVAQDMAGPEPFADDADIYVPIVSKGFQHQFWLAVRAGAEAKAEELNMEVNFIGPENESQVDKQMEMLQAEYDKDPDAVCFAALDSVAAIPLLEQMQADGIPVVAFDSGVDSDIPVTTAATDNVAAAALAAEKMFEMVGEGAQVGVIVHDQTSRTGIDRTEGFINKAEELGLEIVGPDFGGGDQLRSTDLAKTMIQGNPDIAGFFGGNEGSAIGVVNAVNELGRDDITVIGYDSGIIQINAIQDGTMAGAVQQNPVGIGAKCVEAAAMALQGMEVPEMIDTGFLWADAETIDDPEVQAVLYE